MTENSADNLQNQQEQEPQDGMPNSQSDLSAQAETTASSEEIPQAEATVELESTAEVVDLAIPEAEVKTTEDVIEESIDSVISEENPVVEIPIEVPGIEVVMPNEENDLDESFAKSKELEENHEVDDVIDYNELELPELTHALEKQLAKNAILDVKDEVEHIRVVFYKKYNAAQLEARNAFVETGGLIEDFRPANDPDEEKFKTLYNTYREQRAELNEKLENEKQQNIRLRNAVIENIEGLINSTEALDDTFNDFKRLQEKWREIGPVPQGEIKGIWDKYHYTVERFYDYIKINKELRDLDLRKNFEAKVKLCERAEELIVSPSIVNAFKELQELHAEWREVGPVPREKKEDIWDRFKLATTQINKAHQEYYEKLKDEQEQNLKAKTLLCEKVEEIIAADIVSFKDWEDRGNEVIEIQKIWKLVGFTPRKFNNEIYLRFRTACDAFFNKKRDFYTAAKDEQRINMNRKMELIEQAEALSVSTEWKKTTDIYVNIQKQWKEIGPVPRKFSDAIWERFRAACNKFFNLKKEHFSGLDNAHAENLRLKKEIIEKLRNFDSSGDNHEDIEILKTLQNEWSEIGHVPFHDKDAIQTEYRELIGNQFQRLRLDVNARQEHKFKNRIDNLKQSPKGNSKIKFEREKLVRKLQKIEKDIITWENNIGFFANSKNANDLIKDIEQKIVDAKEYAVQVREKLDLLEDGE